LAGRREKVLLSMGMSQTNFKFKENLKTGKVGESQIARWLQSKGHHVLPVYEIEKDQYAGPALYASDGSKIIAPDMLIFNKEKIVWIEAGGAVGGDK